MAHQAHNLPWNALSSSLEAVKTGPRGTPQRITILSPTPGAAAEKKRSHFARIFARVLADFAGSERRKHPATPSLSSRAPVDGDPRIDDDDEPILTDAAVASVEAHMSSPHANGRLAAWRTAHAWPRAYRTARGWRTTTGYGDVRAEIVMALIAAGELGALLKLAALRFPFGYDDDASGFTSPLAHLWSYPGCNPGVSNVLYSALGAYLFFNVLSTRGQELWGAGVAPQRDYRDGRAFGAVVGAATACQDGDAWTVPHRAFYGGWQGGIWSGQEAEAKRALDPMDPRKAGELRDYLRMCWDHLVRVHVVLAEAGVGVEWETEAKWIMVDLWGRGVFAEGWWCCQES